MASNESIFDKLNLSSGERRLVMFVAVVLIFALAWMVWGMIPSPGVTKTNIAKAEKELERFQAEISKTDEYNRQMSELEGLGSAVVPIEQQVNMSRFIRSLTSANNLDVTDNKPMKPKTSEFFIEQSTTIRFTSKESDLVNFLWKMGESDSMVRVSQLRIYPDKNRYRLNGTMTVTASYQKDFKASRVSSTAAKPESELVKSAAKPDAAAKPEPEPAKSAAEPDTVAEPKSEPAKSEAKPTRNKRTVPKRTVPSRRVRQTQ